MQHPLEQTDALVEVCLIEAHRLEIEDAADILGQHVVGRDEEVVLHGEDDVGIGGQRKRDLLRDPVLRLRTAVERPLGEDEHKVDRAADAVPELRIEPAAVHLGNIQKGLLSLGEQIVVDPARKLGTRIPSVTDKGIKLLNCHNFLRPSFVL